MFSVAAQNIPTAGRDTLHTSEYSRSSRELIEFVAQLRALGAHYDLELPRIVVIGNQSAGKSSLVEAISGISVPRDAGTCTRCPMECRLSHSTGKWSCQVKVRYEYDETGKRLKEVEEVDFGPLLTDKAQVEPMLRRVQSAVLHPTVPRATFLRDDFSEEIKRSQSLKFSKNIVCVEPTGPELADLSFVDLPGIVQNAEADVVQLVEDMVNSYIQGNSLILVTLPMSDDIENQKAARLAHLADPLGLRTIGIMTKPDTITAGSTKTRDMWLEVLEGRRHPLLHGYYCTRQPDDDERVHGVSGAVAREAEGPPTSCEVLAISLRRLSVNRCQDFLVTSLTSWGRAMRSSRCSRPRSRQSRPRKSGCRHTELVQGTRRAYEAFKHAIRSSAPSFVPYENAASSPRDVSEYTGIHSGDDTRNGRATSASGDDEGKGIMYLEDVRRHIRASVTRELPGNMPYAAKTALIQAFQQTWEEAAMRCFQAVQTTFTEAVAGAVRAEFDRYRNLKVVVGRVTDELTNSCAAVTVAQIRAILALETPPFTQNGHYLAECRNKWLAKYKEVRATKSVAECVTPVAPPATVSMFTFGAGLPLDSSMWASGAADSEEPSRDSPTTVTTQPVIFNNTRWTAGTQTRMQESSGWASKPMSKNKKRRWKKGYQKGQKQVYTSTPTTSSTDVSPLDWSADIPAPPPSWLLSPSPSVTTSPTKNGSTNTVETDGIDKEQLVNGALAALTKLGYTGLTEDDLGKLNKADEYEDEIQLMAEVRAYFQVAYNRVIDYVPLIIDHNFLYAFANKLNERLFEQLGLGAANASARCSAYLAEDPGVVATRDELLSKKKRLEGVQRALYNFGL